MPGCFWRVLISQLLGIRAFRWRSRRRNAFNLLLREVMCILFITSFTHFIPIPSYIHFLLIPFSYILSQYPFYAFSHNTFLYILFNSFRIHSRPIFLIQSLTISIFHTFSRNTRFMHSLQYFFSDAGKLLHRPRTCRRPRSSPLRALAKSQDNREPPFLRRSAGDVHRRDASFVSRIRVGRKRELSL